MTVWKPSGPILPCDVSKGSASKDFLPEDYIGYMKHTEAHNVKQAAVIQRLASMYTSALGPSNTADAIVNNKIHSTSKLHQLRIQFEPGLIWLIIIHLMFT